MTHTPAPWLTLDNNFVYALNEDGTNRFDLTIRKGYETQNGRDENQWSKTSNEEISANAYLIAAAPDLLEALEKLVEARKRGHYCGEWSDASDAITKAKQITN